MAPPVSNGQPDSYFIAEVRRILRDQLIFVQESPASDGARGAYGVAGSPILHLQRAPIARTVVALTAVAGATQPGFASYIPLFDPPPPTFNPAVAPVLSDGGAGGTLAAATYQVAYTFVLSGVEQGMSLPSNSQAIAVNHQLTVGALSSLPAAVTAIRYYLISATAGGSNVGFVGTQAVVGNAVPAFTFGAPGNGILPALIVTDTAELFFPQAPNAGTISVQYQTSRFGDQQVTDALYEGLDMVWPEIWNYQPYDTTSVLPSPVQWEYTLPSQYQDLRAVITSVEWRPPSAFIIFKRISGWRFLDDPVTPTLIFDRPPPPGGVVRIRYVLPFSTLGQVPTIAQFLPVYYAVARLLADQEVMRSRADDLPALTGENAGAEKGGSIQTAAWWLQNKFAPALQKLSLGPPIRTRIMDRAVEKLGLGPVWQGAP